MIKVVRMLAGVCLASALLTTSVSAESFNDVVKKVEGRIEPAVAKRGQTVSWKVTVDVNPPWHTYPTRQSADPDSTFINKFEFPQSNQVVFVGELQEPNSVHREMVKNIGFVDMITESGTWERPFIVRPDAAPGKYQLKGRVKVLVCNEDNCLTPQWVPVSAELTIDGEPPVAIDPRYKDEFEKASSTPQPPARDQISSGNNSQSIAPPVPVAVPESKGQSVAPPAASVAEHEANLKAVREQIVSLDEVGTRKSNEGLIGFLLTAAFWGAVALVTPCVFPMIPITVSFFLKQSEREHHKPFRMAAIYCGTIILVLGISALTLLTFFRSLSVRPVTNVFLGALFLFFAFSLLGMYEITLPTSLTRFTSSREGRGGIIGTVFMALTFTIVSFTCVAPFLGGFGGMAASGQFTWLELVLGALVFSTTFAAPFFVLALFPSLIKKLPKSGSWLNSVKVVMGLLEIAAALKFFRTAELRLLDMPAYFTYDLVMGIWIALAIICGLYLLNLIRLSHDEAHEGIGVVRLLLGLAFIALGIYLVPALFKQDKGENQRPGGVVYAWIDSFLLPEPSHEDLPWSVNLKGTIDEARKELEKSGKPQFVFLDNTGVTCTNCKYNERTVFTQGEIRKLFADYRLVQHYTDEVPASFYSEVASLSDRESAAEANLQFQKDVFKDERLPLYATLEVTKDKVYIRAIYREGKINDVNAFADFLRKSTKPRAAK